MEKSTRQLSYTFAAMSGSVLVFEIPYIIGVDPVSEGGNVVIALAYGLALGAVVGFMHWDFDATAFGRFFHRHQDALARLGVLAAIHATAFAGIMLWRLLSRPA